MAGAAVHIAARLMSEASPDEILTSQTVKDLTLGSDHSFCELGRRELRGIGGEWTLFAVTN
ncbi:MULTISPECIES: hypothetical protein [unclassified Ruegeria]|uniref:hypothetical protein n=1 Tax=unclassified Ruegeria TaxID=2625375 RepID=UPI0014928A5E|nr:MULTISPECIES: hypothetical protein [unclassified Ruegeria]NOD49279.1 hypothetical protein [Ruegeria sp. HKCCD5849]NOD53422.1 hypothetical protein [Ruegeria sp. HKCCD5851]NOD70268.1 hypothetical protein [Ruegeria sp. HKCCD7303]